MPVEIPRNASDAAAAFYDASIPRPNRSFCVLDRRKWGVLLNEYSNESSINFSNNCSKVELTCSCVLDFPEVRGFEMLCNEA